LFISLFFFIILIFNLLLIFFFTFFSPEKVTFFTSWALCLLGGFVIVVSGLIISGFLFLLYVLLYPVIPPYSKVAWLFNLHNIYATALVLGVVSKNYNSLFFDLFFLVGIIVFSVSYLYATIVALASFPFF
jgi:hypothetical protein